MITKIVLGSAVLFLLIVTLVQDNTNAGQTQLIRQMAASPGCLGALPMAPPPAPALYHQPALAPSPPNQPTEF